MPPMQSTLRVVGLVPLLLLLLLLAVVTSVRADSDVQVFQPVPEGEHDQAYWLEPLGALAQRIMSLPYEPASAGRALRYIQTHRTAQLANEEQLQQAEGEGGTPVLAGTDWSYRVPSVRITRAELRSFPSSADMRPDFDGTVLDMDAEADDQEGADDSTDRDAKHRWPRILRPSLIHVLAMRGFDEALKSVLEFIPLANRTAAVNAHASMAATLRLKEMAPLHLLALYAPDTSPSTKHGNVVAARLLEEAGANATAHAGGERARDDSFTPLVFAGERGQLHLLEHFLSTQVPSTFEQPPAAYSRTPVQAREFTEWSEFRESIVRQEVEGLPLIDEAGALVQWAEYLTWYDSHRPRTPEEEAVERLQAALFKTLELSVVANQLAVVRRLLTGPFGGYGLLARINERSHGGRGDCLLHGAVAHGLQDMADLLLRHGADPSLPSYDGLSLVQLALQYEQFPMAQWMEDYLRMVKPPVKSPRGHLDEAYGSAYREIMDSVQRTRGAHWQPTPEVKQEGQQEQQQQVAEGHTTAQADESTPDAPSSASSDAATAASPAADAGSAAAASASTPTPSHDDL